MAKKTGRNRNTTDASVTTTVNVGSTTAVTVAAANPDRISVLITNPNNQAFWVRERPAASDNLKDGEGVLPAGKYRTIPDNIYTGEISVIFETGGGTKPVIIVEK